MAMSGIAAQSHMNTRHNSWQAEINLKLMGPD